MNDLVKEKKTEQKALIILNASLVDANGINQGDLFIEDGIIVKKRPQQAKVIDGKGLVVMPSFVDLHAHFREPGLTYKEDLYSGSQAAVAGGYTTVVAMANTKPVCSSLQMKALNEKKAQSIGLVDLIQCLSVTNGFDGETLSHLEALTENHGCKIISDDGFGVENEEVMRKALILAKDKGIIVSSHAEYAVLTKKNSRISENMMTRRDVRLAKETKGHLHMAHVSTKEAIEDIFKAKEKGARITCEITPHHLALNQEEVNYKVNPSLRTKSDQVSLKEAIKKRIVDAIATDHAPHTLEDKEKGAPGISGIETAFAVCYTELVKENVVSLAELSFLMSANPRKILSLYGGYLSNGNLADLVLIDLNSQYKINTKQFYSKGKNTPFEGKKCWGKILMTIKKGEIVFQGE